jgi:hypothetical protein
LLLPNAVKQENPSVSLEEKKRKKKREERKTNSFLLTNLLMAGMSTLNRILIFSLPCTNGSVAVSISPYHSSSVSLVTSSFLLPYLSLHMSVHSVLVLMGPSILSESPNVLKEGIAGFSWIPPLLLLTDAIRSQQHNNHRT